MEYINEQNILINKIYSLIKYIKKEILNKKCQIKYIK